MDSFTKNKIASQEVTHRPQDVNFPNAPRQIDVFDYDTKPSWKTYGSGTAKLSISASQGPKDGAPWISVNTTETSLGQKRDTEKQTFFTLYGPSALEVYKMLKGIFEPET